jgi:hypothetical protein
MQAPSVHFILLSAHPKQINKCTDKADLKNRYSVDQKWQTRGVEVERLSVTGVRIPAERWQYMLDSIKLVQLKPNLS